VDEKRSGGEPGEQPQQPPPPPRGSAGEHPQSPSLREPRGDAAAGECVPSEEGGRKPPPDDLSEDPAHEPDGPLKDIKGG
jgi:hypothetical protein